MGYAENIQIADSPQTDSIPGIVTLNYLPICPNELYKVALENKDNFKQSTILGYKNFRFINIVNQKHRNTLSLRSSYTKKFEDICRKFLENNRDLLSRHFGSEAAEWETFSVALLAYGDGCFFSKHADIGHSFSEKRVISFVYMCHKEPKKFTGGELVIYSKNGSILKTIEPTNGLLVLFDPNLTHEVKPVHLPSDSFEDRRFVLVGWALVTYSKSKTISEFTKALLLRSRNIPGISVLYRLYKKYLRPLIK